MFIVVKFNVLCCYFRTRLKYSTHYSRNCVCRLEERFEFADKAFLRPKPKTAIYIRAQYPLKIQRAEFLYVTMNSLQVFACTIDSEGAIFH